MFEDLRYIPVFRGRQQELMTLKEFDFGAHLFPMIEVIKEKDRINNSSSSDEIYSEIIKSIQARKVFIDLPTYLKQTTSTQKEVIKFMNTVLGQIDARISFFKSLSSEKEKVVPVISSLTLINGEVKENEMLEQFTELSKTFTNFAFKVYLKSFDHDVKAVKLLLREVNPADHILIYDIDQNEVTAPIVRKQIAELKDFSNKAIIRSAINDNVQNTNLINGELVEEINNSLMELYKDQGFKFWGDYAGIKKDSLTSGGTISPGFLFFDAYNNFFYGFKGQTKSLNEFEDTIIPSILGSEAYLNLRNNFPEFINDNPGIKILNDMSDGLEPSRSQAKFKKIAMLHYLFSIKTSIEKKCSIPLALQ